MLFVAVGIAVGSIGGVSVAVAVSVAAISFTVTTVLVFGYRSVLVAMVVMVACFSCC